MGTSILEQKYRIDKCIAKGGQGSLWRATHRLGNPVAVKVCAPDLAADPVQRRRFLTEGYICNQIPSKHVLTALDDGLTPDGIPFIVYPWIDGQNAEQLRVRAGGRLSPQVVAAIAVQALGGLAAAHRVGIVHRDMKPENVLIDHHDGQVYVIDWGGASFRAELGTLTASHAFPPITLVYTAPEQARGEEATARSDLFSVGAMMFALLSGRWPRIGAHPLAVLLHAANHPIPRLRDVAPDVPEKLAAIVDRATAFDPQARPPNATDMWADLARIM